MRTVHILINGCTFHVCLNALLWCKQHYSIYARDGTYLTLFLYISRLSSVYVCVCRIYIHFCRAAFWKQNCKWHEAIGKEMFQAKSIRLCSTLSILAICLSFSLSNGVCFDSSQFSFQTRSELGIEGRRKRVKERRNYQVSILVLLLLFCYVFV